jgi:hypothetical protein
MPEDNQKKVRINGNIEVKELTELGLDNRREKRYDTIQLDPKDRPHKHRASDRDKNIHENSDPYNSKIPNFLTFFRGTIFRVTKTKYFD